MKSPSVLIFVALALCASVNQSALAASLSERSLLQQRVVRSLNKETGKWNRDYVRVVLAVQAVQAAAGEAAQGAQVVRDALVVR